RFGESQGFERDKVRDHAWRYRDYVIRSFNEDKSYPQFVKEQVAGDVLEPVTAEGVVATGFLVAGPWDEVGAMQQGALMRMRVRAGGLSAVRTPSPEWGLAPDAPEGRRRRKLADWIASADNPLTARVMVNRVWHYHFGQGIVETPNDFGANGGRPTHPELLDWL